MTKQLAPCPVCGGTHIRTDVKPDNETMLRMYCLECDHSIFEPRVSGAVARLHEMWGIVE